LINEIEEITLVRE